MVVPALLFASLTYSSSESYGHGEILFASEIPFGRLDGGVSEEKLDLFEVPAGLTAELGAGTAEVIGTEASDDDVVGQSIERRPRPPSR